MNNHLMHVQVNNENALQAELGNRPRSCHCDVVEQAEALATALPPRSRTNMNHFRSDSSCLCYSAFLAGGPAAQQLPKDLMGEPCHRLNPYRKGMVRAACQAGRRRQIVVQHRPHCSKAAAR